MEPNKIDLAYSNGNVFVWSAEDWLKLRKDYRIIGECIGCLAKLPRQDIISGLPMLLLPEEAKLLLEKGVARLIEYPCLKQEPSEALKTEFEEYRERLYTEQQECMREQRKLQIESVLDNIIEGKRRKILGLETRKKKIKKQIKKQLDEESKKALDEVVIDREALKLEEMLKLPKLDKSEALVQTHTIYPWTTQDIVEVKEWNYPSGDESIMKYKVFKNLWERGYYITSGEKFGHDFLAYPGDPIMFHSQLLVQCQKKDEQMSVTELITQCRIGSHVRKTLVFATISKDDTVEYFSFQWTDAAMVDS